MRENINCGEKNLHVHDTKNKDNRIVALSETAYLF